LHNIIEPGKTVTSPHIFIPRFPEGGILSKPIALLSRLMLLCIVIHPAALSSQGIVCPVSGSAHTHLPHLLLQPGDNTYLAYELLYRLKQEVSRRSSLHLDSVLSWADQAKQIFDEEGQLSRLAQVNSMQGQAYMEKDMVDKARISFEEAIQNATAADDPQQLTMAYLKYGWSFIYGNHYEKAVDFTLKALTMARQAGDSSLVIEVYRNLPRIYYIKQDLLNAYKASVELIDISKAVNDIPGYIYGNHLVSDIYGDLGLHAKQMKQMHYCLSKVKDIKDRASLYTIYSTAYEAYLKNSMSDSALHYAKLLLPFSVSLNIENVGIDKIANAFYESAELDSARLYYEQSIANNIRNNNYIDTYKFLHLGNIEFRLGNYEKAFTYYQLAETDIQKPTRTTRSEIYKALYVYFDHFGKHEQANTYLKKYVQLTDTIHSVKSDIAFLEKKADLQDNQIALLSKDKELHAAIVHKQQQQNKIVYTSASIILLLGGLALYRFKKIREMQNQEALNNDRLRISRELHDEVGSTLSGIAMYSHVAKEQMRSGDTPGVTDSLSVMQTSATDMVKKLSDIVWLINPERDTIAELFDRLGVYARQMGAARKMAVRIDMTPQLADLHIPPEARRNIYLFCKEAINNAVKYSNGSFIELKVLKSGGHVRFSVRDDGDGFDEMIVKHGNGLRNMVKRAEAIGALCHINTKPKQGAHIEMQYKLIQ
jgi:signal transduction histidine kinase